MKSCVEKRIDYEISIFDAVELIAATRRRKIYKRKNRNERTIWWLSD